MLLQRSVAFQTRVIVAGQVPLTVSEKVTTGFGSQLSVADALPVLLGLVDTPHVDVVFGGHVITGGIVSTTVIVCTQVALWPQASVACQVRLIIFGQVPLTWSV